MTAFVRAAFVFIALVACVAVLGWLWLAFIALYILAGETIYFLVALAAELDADVNRVARSVTDQQLVAVALWPLISIDLLLNRLKDKGEGA